MKTLLGRDRENQTKAIGLAVVFGGGGILFGIGRLIYKAAAWVF